MRGEHVVGLVEGLHRDLPVAVEVQPLAPLVAHVLQPERVEDLRGGKQVVRQRFTVRIHVDEQPTAPGVDLNRSEMGVLRRQLALPVVLLADVRARAVESVCPAVESADERLACSATGILGTVGGVDQPTAAMHAHVVMCLEFVWTRAHDDDRVVEDVVGQVVADLGDLLDPADLLPHLAPQLVAFGAGIRPPRCRPRHRWSSVRDSSSMSAFDFQLGHRTLLEPTYGATERFVLEEQ